MEFISDCSLEIHGEPLLFQLEPLLPPHEVPHVHGESLVLWCDLRLLPVQEVLVVHGKALGFPWVVSAKYPGG